MTDAGSALDCRLNVINWVLGRQLGPIMRRWMRRDGIPEQVVFPPEHCRKLAGIYADEDLWPKLYGMQHDEKDIFRKVGTGGVQDWGDGVAQELLNEQERLCALLAAEGAELKKLDSRHAPPAAQHISAAHALRTTLAGMHEHQRLAAVRAADNEAKVTKLRRKRDALPSTRLTEQEWLNKHITFLQIRTIEVASFKDRLDRLNGLVTSLPPAPTLATTAATLLALVTESSELLDKGFGLAHVPASKVRLRAVADCPSLLPLVHHLIARCRPSLSSAQACSSVTHGASLRWCSPWTRPRCTRRDRSSCARRSARTNRTV